MLDINSPEFVNQLEEIVEKIANKVVKKHLELLNTEIDRDLDQLEEDLREEIDAACIRMRTEFSGDYR